MRWLCVWLGLWGAGCFEAPALRGPFRCDTNNACGSTGWVCDDGLCCSPDGDPPCRTRLTDEGQCPNGKEPRTYFEDLDQDGYGNDGHSRWACALPVTESWAARGGDCNDLPTHQGVQSHPGAVEVCDGLDNDCNGLIDDKPVGQEQACEMAGARGLCAGGLGDCRDGAWVCVSPHRTQRDVCDGLDNDCDGEIDEAPDCGGPVNLMASSSDLKKGARVFPTGLNGGVSITGCLKNDASASAGYFSWPSWTGSGATSHLFWVESDSPWDLSADGLALNLEFAYSMLNAPSKAWASHGQPVVYLCDDRGGHARFVHFVRGYSTPLTQGPSGSVSTWVPMAGNSEWVIGANVNVDLSRVIRVELLVQPTRSSDGGTPTFTITFPTDGGFGFRRTQRVSP